MLEEEGIGGGRDGFNAKKIFNCFGVQLQSGGDYDED